MACLAFLDTVLTLLGVTILAGLAVINRLAGLGVTHLGVVTTAALVVFCGVEVVLLTLDEFVLADFEVLGCGAFDVLATGVVRPARPLVVAPSFAAVDIFLMTLFGFTKLIES